LCWNEEEVQKDTERRAAILASLESQYIVDDLSGLSEVEVEVEQEHWNTRHDSDAFKLTRPLALTAIGNKLGFWKREQLDIELELTSTRCRSRMDLRV
jgi:hypothetical protein